MFEIKGNVTFHIQNLRDGNEITSTMQSGEMVINETVIPFIMQRRVSGRIKDMRTKSPTYLGVMRPERNKSTTFTRQGYISFLMTMGHAQIYAYIKKERLRDFLLAIASV